MCDICKTVEQKLDTYLTQLVDEHPGTRVQGEPVELSHHMETALLHAAMTRLPLDMKVFLFSALKVELELRALMEQATEAVGSMRFGGRRDPFAA